MVFWLSGIVNVSRSSIRGPDKAVIDDCVKKSLFFAYEGSKQKCQLTSQRRRSGQNVNNKAKSNLKLLISFSFFKCGRCLWWLLLSFLSLLMMYPVIRSASRTVIRILLMRGGIESNPGPGSDRALAGFQLLSQNCRGLTDKKKLAKLIRNIYPVAQRSTNKSMIAG